MLKSVGSSGQLTLGKRYAGRYFEIEELPNGELLLRPVKVVPEAASNRAPEEKPAFEIAEVERVILPSREERNARR
jgi:hypothetical protein